MVLAVSSLARRRLAVLAALEARTYLLVCIGVTLALRLPFVSMPLGIDEGGYAYVAAHWGQGDGGIYGAQWVDRPPLLMALYASAHALAGDVGIRLLGCVAAVVVVAACAASAERVAGHRAMRWSALIAAMLASSTATQANTVNAELPAIAFTASAAWLVVLAATTSNTATRPWIALLAGIAATCAMLVKQSFADGFAFALAFGLVWGLAARRVRGPGTAAAAFGLLGAGALGAGVALSATAAWAEIWGPGTSALLDALYGFRLEARAAIEAAPNAPNTRAWFLFTVAAMTGMLSMLVFVVIGLLRVAARPLPGSGFGLEAAVVVRAGASGLLAMGAVSLLGVLMGGNWWLHYLTQLAPFLAVGTGVVVAAPPRPRSRLVRAARRWAALLVVSTFVAWGCAVGWSYAEGPQRTPTAIGEWLATAAQPGDTAIVTWGHANVLHRSGLRSPYRLSWSLPVRVQDPELEELWRVMRGPDAPTFIVQWRPIESWGLDPSGRVRRTVWRRYERLPDVCGKRIYRLRSRAGDAVPSAPGAACGSGRVLSFREVKVL